MYKSSDYETKEEALKALDRDFLMHMIVGLAIFLLAVMMVYVP